MQFLYIGIILLVSVVIVCGVVYLKRDSDTKGESVHMAKKREREVFEGRKILCIGNSYGDDSVKYVREIAENLGVKNVVIANLFIGGCSLEQHRNNAVSGEKLYEYRKNANGEWVNKSGVSLNEGVLDEDWDMIVFQQQSAKTGKWSTYVPFYDQLKAHVRCLRPNAKMAFNMTWAYPTYSKSSQFADFNNDQETMYGKICSVVSTRIDTDYEIHCVIPTGTAVQNARALVGETLNRDDIHLNENGRFLASLTWVKEIFGVNIDDLSYAPDFVSREQADAYIQAVNDAYEYPFYVTSKK
jgi:hypothetical protein